MFDSRTSRNTELLFVLRGVCEQGVQKPLAQALAARGWGYDDVFQFPFRGDLVRDEETMRNRFLVSDGVRCGNGNRRVFGDEHESCGFSLESLPILLFGPVAGSGGLPLQFQDGRNVDSDCRTDQHGVFGLSACAGAS